jgi:hypothetical protein
MTMLPAAFGRSFVVYTSLTPPPQDSLASPVSHRYGAQQRNHPSANVPIFTVSNSTPGVALYNWVEFVTLNNAAHVTDWFFFCEIAASVKDVLTTGPNWCGPGCAVDQVYDHSTTTVNSTNHPGTAMATTKAQKCLERNAPRTVVFAVSGHAIPSAPTLPRIAAMNGVHAGLRKHQRARRHHFIKRMLPKNLTALEM